MQQHIDTHAHATEHGVQAQCPTTGETYIATEIRITGNAIWTLCGCCDALRNTFEDCDPELPQWHLHSWSECNETST